jgi:hypothetical protein
MDIDDWIIENASVPGEPQDINSLPQTQIDDPLDEALLNLADPFPKEKPISISQTNMEEETDDPSSLF